MNMNDVLYVDGAPDDDGLPFDDSDLLSANCSQCGSLFFVPSATLIDGQIPGGELCGDCEVKSNLTKRAADGVCPSCGKRKHWRYPLYCQHCGASYSPRR